jgi:hypothetical protein
MAKGVPLEPHSALALLEVYFSEGIKPLVESRMFQMASENVLWDPDGTNPQHPTFSPAMLRGMGLLEDWPQILEALREAVSGSPRQGYSNPPEFRPTP